ncbi:MAG: hypothetical protein DYG98_03140 [Haliscomenobacteraceae bacterium CHB4]|nr:hypothetical protein [Saprospiraceae bacterium]MCE7922026.1 hypothetical protein [Haliscomenobacteraceae bacterium CHB4]
MHTKIFIAAIISVLFTPDFNSLAAQNVGVGFQVGDPTGLNLHFRNTKPMRLDILFAWDFNDHDDDRDFFFVNVHGLWFKPIGGSEPFNFYYGPGAFIGVRERNRKNDDDDETVLGASGNFGINYEFPRVDIFLQLTPRLELISDTDFDIGGGLGVRFFF